MARLHLPQLDGGLFLTDSGMETTLIYHDGVELPEFASFVLLRDQEGRARVAAYYARHLQIAEACGTGFILETPTWRASASWGSKLGLSHDDLDVLNAAAVGMMKALKDEFALRVDAIVISGNVGPRGDGYVPGDMMTAGEAQAYHAPQIGTLAGAGADMISAFTLNYTAEAIGIARAAEVARIPCVLSFTVETDGRLPTGQSLAAAIEETDAATGGSVAYYMINCAHPDHFAGIFDGGAWQRRIRGLRANASRRSHAELNEASELDAGDPHELGAQYAALCARLPHLTVLGGCCGTDHRHVAAIAQACTRRHAA